MSDFQARNLFMYPSCRVVKGQFATAVLLLLLRLQLLLRRPLLLLLLLPPPQRLLLRRSRRTAPLFSSSGIANLKSPKPELPMMATPLFTSRLSIMPSASQRLGAKYPFFSERVLDEAGYGHQRGSVLAVWCCSVCNF